jgi:hypothetical protein
VGTARRFCLVFVHRDHADGPGTDERVEVGEPGVAEAGGDRAR